MPESERTVLESEGGCRKAKEGSGKRCNCLNCVGKRRKVAGMREKGV